MDPPVVAGAVPVPVELALRCERRSTDDAREGQVCKSNEQKIRPLSLVARQSDRIDALTLYFYVPFFVSLSVTEIIQVKD